MKSQKIINPSNGEVICEVGLADKDAVDAVLEEARRAYDLGPWRNFSLAERKEILLKISQGILENAQALAQLETINTGKPIKESTFMDIPSSAQTFQYFAEHLQEYLVEEKVEIKTQIASASAALIREPLGVAALIVPWNYPLLIASWKVAQALAAGNTVILKPSSLTPLTALELAKIVERSGLPKGVFNIVVGSGQEIGKALCSDNRVDMISFTGSNSVGREIVSFAARYSKKLLMELGGKSASLVLKDADIDLAVNGSLCSIFLNQGQMCTAMSRLLVEDDIYNKFVDEFVDKVKRIKLGPGEDFETQMGPLISEAQRQKIYQYVGLTQKAGARLLCGGKAPDEPALKKGFFFEPTVFTDVHPQMSIFKEEIFGPVVTIHRFSDTEEAITLANNSSFGLAACIWTKDISVAQEISRRINSGTIWVNTYGMFFNEVPYGGFKQSGFGKELGKEGFLEYTRLKSILTDRTENSQPIVRYWYGF
ncbi:MAG: aldehyde dehydrogenase family protein [Candidatus Omnitrophica bacterium]|nr:aldehyde dehydrogenase family protein [Candidatus Omnitrophota bacterium]